MRSTAALLLGLWAASPASAAESSHGRSIRPVSLVVIDLRPADTGGAAQGPETFAYSGRAVAGQLLALVERAIDPDRPLGERLAAIRETGQKAREHSKESALRVVSDEGETVRVAVLFDATLITEEARWRVTGRRPQVTFDEQPRASRLQTDLATLVQLGAALAGVSAAREGTTMPVAWLVVQDHRLRTERATLTITATLGEEAVALASGGGDAAAPVTRAAGPGEALAPDQKQSSKVALVTGPREHWFLSADVPLTGASQLKLDAQTGLLELASEPSTFYVGVNFLLGDLLAARQSIADVLAVKLLVKASKNPLDSLGVALALRGRYLRKYGLDFDLVSPFVGYTFTLEDEVSPSGEVVTNGGRNAELRFGASLNLDKALGWIKGK
jgi:hypothetical protein